MSRARRKTPISGVTTAESEKTDKRIYNRRYRHATKQLLDSAPKIESVPSLRAFSNPWSMDKDGKKYFDPVTYPKLMRK